METDTPNPEADAIELASLRTQLADTATAILAAVPENLRGIIPGALSPAEQVTWFHTAKAAGVFDKPTVAATDAGTKAAITPIATDPSSLPLYARMATGYRT